MTSLKLFLQLHHEFSSLILFSRSFHKCPFEIPAPIERGPTDLLQALADTVGRDETAPNYAYIDDPLMIPINPLQRKNYFLAKEYGRRTAIKLVEEWPTLFMFDRDQPRLAAFRPQKSPDIDVVEATEENLLQIIANRQIVDAQKLYKRICNDEKQPEKSGSISPKIELDLFRMLCYYSSNDLPFEYDEKWSSGRLFPTHEDYTSREWEQDGLAEKLFEKIQPKTDEIYSTLICGLCKFPSNYSTQRAKELYQEMISNGLIPFEQVFNYMIKCKIKLGSSDVFNPMDWLCEMIKFTVRPTINTFNSIFSTLQISPDPESSSKSKDNTPEQEKQQQWKLAQSLISEMNRLQITHSLTVYGRMLVLEPKNEIQTRVNMLDAILSLLENRLKNGVKIDWTDSEDCTFFSSALTIAAEAHNESLLDRLMYIYMHERNQVKFIDLSREARFITEFLCFKLWLLPLNTFLVLYKTYVPNVVPLNHYLSVTILNEIRKRKPDEFDWYLLKRVIGDTINAKLISFDRLACTVIEHLLDIKPSLHLSTIDAKDYFTFCQRFIELMDKIEEYRELAKEYNKKNLLDNAGADDDNIPAHGANAEPLSKTEETQ